jgi:hypothetical protein
MLNLTVNPKVNKFFMIIVANLIKMNTNMRGAPRPT